MFLKIMSKIELKIITDCYGFNFKFKTVVNNYDFNLKKKIKTIISNYGINLKKKKKIQTVIINYGFDEDTLVWA